MKENEKMTAAGEEKEIFGEDAAKMAKQVCGIGECMGCFNCGHENKCKNLLPQYGKGSKCPLEEYNVAPDKRTFRERIESGEYTPGTEETLNGLFALCACCEHSGIIEKDGLYELCRTDEAFIDYCIDCPVNMARESTQECLSEAGMS